MYIREPRQDLCCLCGKPERSPSDFVLERRPSGRDFALQAWSYCASCWNETAGVVVDHDLVAARYLAFLRFLILGRPLPRTVSTNHSFRIPPK